MGKKKSAPRSELGSNRISPRDEEELNLYRSGNFSKIKKYLNKTGGFGYKVQKMIVDEENIGVALELCSHKGFIKSLHCRIVKKTKDRFLYAVLATFKFIKDAEIMLVKRCREYLVKQYYKCFGLSDEALKICAIRGYDFSGVERLPKNARKLAL